MTGGFTAMQKWAKLFFSGSLVAAALAMTVPAASATELLVGATARNRLVVFSSDTPQDVDVVNLRGLAKGERILGLDVRPATGQLYAPGSTSRIYTIDIRRKVATPVGSGPFTPALRGDFFGFDFNPTVDRIRIISDANQNLRLHPDTGVVASVDKDLAYAAGDSGFGLDPSAVGAAYTNNDNDPATGTTLYDVDAALDALVVQNPPNDGVLVTVGPLGVFTPNSLLVGFDIAGSNGTASAALQTPGSDRTQLYEIDLATGTASLVGTIGGRQPLTALATLGPMSIDFFGNDD